MKIEIHPSASDNFNKKADELLRLVKEFPIEPPKRASFPSDLHVAGSITEKDIIGDVDLTLSDYRGDTVARFFHFNRKRFGLDESDYKRLKEIAEGLHSLPAIRRALSCSFVEKTLFSWIRKKYEGADASDLFVEYLGNEAGEIIRTRISWIPIANLEVQAPFPISKSEIRPLSKDVIDQWKGKLRPCRMSISKELPTL